jgi:hypothetical protein
MIGLLPQSERGAQRAEARGFTTEYTEYTEYTKTTQEGCEIREHEN